MMKKATWLILSTVLGLCLVAALFTVVTSHAYATDGEKIVRRAASPQATNVITIGVAADLSHLVPQLGWQQLNSVQLAVDEINASGGITLNSVNYLLVVVSADSMCNVVTATLAANALIARGVSAVVGHTCSGASMAAQGIYDAYHIPMVSASSTKPDVTTGGYANTFRVITNDDEPIRRLAFTLYRNEDMRRMAIVEMLPPNAPWIAAGLVFSDTFTGQGGEISSLHQLNSTSEFAAAIAQISSEDVDGIFFSSLDAGQAGQFSQQAHNAGMTDVPIAWSPFSEDRQALNAYNAAAGAAREGDWVLFYYRNPNDMPGFAAFNANYIAAGFTNYGSDPGMVGAFAYDAARIIVEAMQSADSSLPDDIRAALHLDTDLYSGVVGDYYGFSSVGENVPQWYWFETYRDNAWQPIIPVGLVSNQGGFNDKSFNMLALQGLQRAESELLVAGGIYTSTDFSEYQANLDVCASQGNALCLSVGFDMATATQTSAENFPEVKFAILDASYGSYPQNLRFITFAEDEVGYLAGALAGWMTESDVVGAVGGWAIPPVVRFVERFGHAAECINPSATAIISYTNSFSDPDLGAQTAQEQIALGADVIFAAAGGTGNGAVLTATQSGVWAIGVDSDQWISLFDSGAVAGSDFLLSSAMKRLDEGAFQTISDLLNDAFTSGEVHMGLAERGVALAPYHETNPFIPATIQNYIKLIEALIIAGEIDIYGACPTFTPEDIFLPIIMLGSF